MSSNSLLVNGFFISFGNRLISLFPFLSLLFFFQAMTLAGHAALSSSNSKSSIEVEFFEKILKLTPLG